MKNVVVVVENEIAAIEIKADATILYLKQGKSFICAPKEPKKLQDGKVQYELAENRRR